MFKWQSMVGYVYPWKATVLENLIKQHVDSNTNCIEVGVLCGKSLMHLLEVGKPKHVFGIDPFTGKHQQTVQFKDLLDIDINYDTQYDYDRVTDHFKEFDNVTIIKDYSPLHNYEMPEIGYAFIDGNHYYDNVLADAEWIYSLMQKGIMVFDDYDLDGVAEALDVFAEKHNLTISTSDNRELAWILVKKG
tara:strand:- start:123 stop:692 length:570 start_codon:yes stop_codon:yes gene_type:complete